MTAPHSEPPVSTPDSPGTAGHELAMSLRGAYLAMHRATNACFAEFGLSADSFTVLTALAEFGAMTQKELGQRIHSDANTVSAMVVRLERRNLIARRRDAQDGRARIVRLTAEGRRLQEGLWKKSRALRAGLDGLFEPEMQMKLVTSLTRIAEAMDPLAIEEERKTR